MTSAGVTPLLRLRGLRKFFASSGVLAVADVDLDVHAGEVVALVGENGTGKSTLMNLLFGALPADAGTIEVDGRAVQVRGTSDAIRHGIGMVQQHFALVSGFTVAQNVALGREPTRRGAVDDRAAEREVAALADRLGLPIDPRTPVAGLPIGLQQRVEILKALSGDTRLLILDEPTAVLTPAEVDELITSVRRLAAGGTAVVFISHKLPEVLAVADRVVVMRRGRVVAEVPVAEATPAGIARAMVGRDVLLSAEVGGHHAGSVVLEVSGLHASQTSAGDAGLVGIDLVVRRGEVVGVAGVSGNGQGDLVDAITGLRNVDAGSVKVDGVEVAGRGPRRARRAGVAHIAEDRMHVGLNRAATLEENAVVTAITAPRFSRAGLVRPRAVRAFADQLIHDYEIRGAAARRVVSGLSGGNLQKIVIGRELEGDPQLIVANQPTRGLDVGSIEFVHGALLAARERGAGILLVSAELEELQALSDRIVVMSQGRLVGPFERGELTTQQIGSLMAGHEMLQGESA